MMKSFALWSPARAIVPAILLVALTQSAVAQDTRRAAPLPPNPKASSRVDVPKLKYTDFTLPNGLRVILHEDHSSPIISTQVLYHVGPKHEVPGKTGLAHLFEHMMDEGTLNMPGTAFKRIIQDAGGSYSAHVQPDWTQYLITIPSHQLETVLWTEAERMANLSPTLDSTRFHSEREAVRNEYREMFLNIQVQSAGEAMIETVFEKSPGYSNRLIGHMSDLETTTVDDLRLFYEKYYVPNNAVLVVAGDFSTAAARRMIAKHFGPIPRGKPVTQPTLVPPLSGEKRIVLEHSSGLRQLWLGWQGAKASAADRPAALALSSILTERLRRLLVTDRKLATALVAAFNQNFDLESSGVFQSVINVSGSATEVERLADSVVTSIRTNGVTDIEVKRWVAAHRMRSLIEMQSTETKAFMLADGALTYRDPNGHFGVVERSLLVKPADVQAAARRYLTEHRVVMSVIPIGKFELISRPELPWTNVSRK